MSQYQFLSDEWWDQARALREEYRDQLPTPTVEIRMNQTVTEIPFGDSDTIETHSVTTQDEGLTFDKGHIDDAEVSLTLDYDTAKAVIVEQDQAAVMQAFMSGLIKVEGDMAKLMAANTAVPNDAEKELAEKLKALTE